MAAGATRDWHYENNFSIVSEPAISAVPQASTSPLLTIRNVAKSFGKTPVLRDISLQVAEGEFLTILGESGSGKTTLLRIIAGFENASSGEILMGNERLDNLPPYRRRVNTVFQHYALFPHMTVAENVGYGLKIARLPREEVATRVEQALAMVKMPLRRVQAVEDQRRTTAAYCSGPRAGEPAPPSSAG